MSLISANSNEIVVGKPLPWAVYDCERNLQRNLLLANKGDIVHDDEHRDALLTGNICHELSWEMPGNNEVGAGSFPAVEAAQPKQAA